MPRVTAIKAQQKRTDWCSIFIDEKYSFSLPLNAISEHKLQLGLELTGEQVAELKKLSSWNKLYEGALRKLARRNHSRREIVDYLRKREATPEDIDSILEKLDEYGYLDDQRFAEQWVKQRSEYKNRSTQQLKAELFKKGVERTVVDSVVNEADDSSALERLIEKKQHLSRYQDENKLIAYLARQGFRYDEIKRALSERAD